MSHLTLLPLACAKQYDSKENTTVSSFSVAVLTNQTATKLVMSVVGLHGLSAVDLFGPYFQVVKMYFFCTNVNTKAILSFINLLTAFRLFR